MGLFNKLFGSKNQELHDEQLGVFKKLSGTGSNIIWTGTTQFLGSLVSIFINGSEAQLDDNQKKVCLEIMADESKFEEKCDEILKREFQNAEKPYSVWKEHFDCISISVINNEVSITFEERGTYYHFNVLFEGEKAVDVTIDS